MDIDPASPGDGANDILYFGAVGLARSDDSGATFTNISNGITRTSIPSFSSCCSRLQIPRSSSPATTEGSFDPTTRVLTGPGRAPGGATDH